MDALSITASIIAIVGLAGKVVSSCRSYLSAIRDAPSDLRTILIEVSSLKNLVENLEFLTTDGADRDLSRTLQNLNSPDGPIHGCRAALANLEKLFPPTTVRLCRGAKRKVTDISLAQLAWPFKKRQAAELLDQIGRYKSTISLSLISDTAHNFSRINSRLTHLCETLDGDSQDKILKWLVTTDPSPNHNAACLLHDARTGNWLSKSPEYQAWHTSKTRFLWLYGIPGAGKTVLLSYIIENMNAQCKSLGSNDVACVYYYCYFGRAQDETSHLLRWTINQLTRRSLFIPNEIVDCFSAGQEPSVPTLVVALSSLVRKFQKIYLLVDALDESLERSNLLDLLLTLAGPGFQNISLLAMSREEIDIKAAIGHTSQSISLSNPFVDDDIRTYVRNQLKKHRKLRTLESPLQTEIETALVEGAKGMFRWAACQIDILGRLYSASDIREALGELPETLDETYERILLNILPRHRRIAHKALQLLAFHGDEFGGDVKSLAEAVIVDVEHLTFSPNDRFLSPDDLFEICTCLITCTEHCGVKLAHYTVKEYLVSGRIKHSPATHFQTSEDTANGLYCKIMLLYLLNISYKSVPSAADYFLLDRNQQKQVYDSIREAFPFIYEATGWDYYSSKVENEVDRKVIDQLIVRLLDTQRANYNKWLEWQGIGNEGSQQYFPRWKARVGLEANVALGYTCYFRGSLGAAKIILSQYPDLPKSSLRLELDFEEDSAPSCPELLEGTPFEMAIILRNEPMIELLLEKGADANSFGHDLRQLPLYTALDNDYDEHGSVREGSCYGSVRLLITAGANPKPRGVVETPLQIAAKYTDCAVVELLLDAGADVNAVGDDEAVVAHIQRDWQDWGDNDLDSLNDSILKRGVSWNYKTPLWIASKRYNRDKDTERGKAEQEKIMDLLKRRDGKSLCLFPVKGLPGYVEEDTESMSTCTPCPDLPPLTFGNAARECSASEFALYFEEFLNSDFNDYFGFYANYLQ